MKSQRDVVVYLEDIVEAADKALEFVDNMTLDEFRRDDKTAFAVVRALEIIGEAAKQVPDEIRVDYPEVPCARWRECGTS